MPVPLLAALGNIGLAANGVQAMAGAAVNAGKAIGGLPWKIEAFGESLIAGKEAMRMYSGTINTAFAKLEVGSALIKSGQAKVTGGSTAGLVEGVLSLKQTLAPWQATFTNGFNKVSTVILGGVVSVLKAMESIPGIGENIKKMREEMEKAEDTPMHSIQFLNDIASGKLSGRVTDRIEVAGMVEKGRSGPADRGAKNWVSRVPGIGPPQ